MKKVLFYGKQIILCYIPLLLLSVASVACSKDSSKKITDDKKVDIKSNKSSQMLYKIEEKQPLIPLELPLAKAPKELDFKANAPMIFAKLQNKVLIPLGIFKNGLWKEEPLFQIENIGEVDAAISSKTITPDLESWWKKLELEEGDSFLLNNVYGKKGVLKIKKLPANVDMGVCTGFAWGIPGSVSWTVRPKNVNKDDQREPVLAFRGKWEPDNTSIEKEISADIENAILSVVDQIKSELSKTLVAIPKDAKWEMCYNLKESPCQTKPAKPILLNIDGNESLDVVIPFLFHAVDASGKKIESVASIEKSVLLTQKGSTMQLLGVWDTGNKGKGGKAETITFIGAVDITGDGRAEFVFEKFYNEVTNTIVYKADDKKIPQWDIIIETKFDGC